MYTLLLLRFLQEEGLLALLDELLLLLLVLAHQLVLAVLALLRPLLVLHLAQLQLSVLAVRGRNALLPRDDLTQLGHLIVPVLVQKGVVAAEPPVVLARQLLLEPHVPRLRSRVGRRLDHLAVPRYGPLGRHFLGCALGFAARRRSGGGGGG
ncbi:hypothetical protein PpBr36_07416 [Pyricularia pennisetigena]|uniref:hypothetical protein n=1 Tax=Pyricularia pennisetigena TaxID=1578925 RepID=UPI001153B1D7|nr:hypothetical protein PpBr36_07416 [Pyricularia pennisetigena]TLS25311.1 hypothetical protein PpBr36_07416 [Pyricularia pennisetigena]